MVKHLTKIIAILALIATTTSATAQESQLTAMFSYASFKLPSGQPYLEAYISIDAWTLQYQPIGTGKYQGTVDITLTATRGDSLVYANHYELNSPIVGDTTRTYFNFIDLQRFEINNGIYNLTLTIKDKNANEPAATTTQKVLINYPQRDASLSSLQLMSSVEATRERNKLSRGGFDMVPYIDNFLPESVPSLYCYFEIYNIDREVFSGEFSTFVYVEEAKTGTRASGIEYIKSFNGKSHLAVLAPLNIAKLPSGNYNIVAEVRNKENDVLLRQQLPVVRSNPRASQIDKSAYLTSFAARITDEQQMNHYLQSLYAIASDAEERLAYELSRTPGALSDKQSFFYTFWQERNALNPESEWMAYRELIDYADKHFSYPNMAGTHTDRGRVLLKYGKPDFVRDEKNYVSTRYLDGSTATQDRLVGTSTTSLGYIYYLPYQLWRYNQLPNDEPYRVFLFWDQFRSGIYTLLNSNARGELRDPKWEQRLSQQQLNEDVQGDVGDQFERGY